MMHQAGILSMVALSAFLLDPLSSPQACQTQNIGPSEGEVVGVGVAVIATVVVGTVVLVEVHKAHHTIKGCVTSGPHGLELETSEKKVYALTGDTPKVKTGDLIQMHGDKIKRAKDDQGDQTFMVQKIKKDYGPCTLSPAIPAVPGSGPAVTAPSPEQ